MTQSFEIGKGGPMEGIKVFFVAAMCLTWILFTSGCASQGRLKVQYRSDTTKAMMDIQENHNQYVIHANEWPAGEVSAIVFDPKGDDRTIENDGWTKVTSKEQLSKLIERSGRNIYRQLFKIYGPNEEFFGYLLGGERYVWIRTIDANTLKLISTNWSPDFGSRYDPFRY
jgi:hypothetical protein